MDIKVASKDGAVIVFDIDEENHVDQMLMNCVFPGIIGLKYELETANT